MQLTRRAAIAAAIAESTRPGRSEAGSRDADDLTVRLGAHLRQHAQFGEKFTGGTGDLQTADWIAARLTAAGYAVEQLRFSAPSFALTRSILTVGGESADVIP